MGIFALSGFNAQAGCRGAAAVASGLCTHDRISGDPAEAAPCRIDLQRTGDERGEAGRRDGLLIKYDR